MSKRESVGNKNTLFNYFAKSPATPKNETKLNLNVSSTSTTKTTKTYETTPKNGTPKNSQKKLTHGKRPSIDTGSPSNKKKSNSDSEDVVTQKTKRRRILAIDSDCSDDSDRENESVTQKPKKAEKRSTGTPNKTSSTKKIKKEKESTENGSEKISIEEKLSSIEQGTIAEIQESSQKIVEEEPTVWTHNKIDFLKPEMIKDANGRKPDHPDYDDRTLYVPEKYLSTLTPAMRQWWVMKSKHYDCVLFFKVGKFYELYHMDATVGVNELGFSYMKGEFAHSGFPESAYDRMVTNLIERGYKVARVEQTENPEMMQERCKKQKFCNKYDRVVNREICQITNRGTQVFGQQVQLTYKHQQNYMLVIAEKNFGSFSNYGICFIDISIGTFNLGEFQDDKHSSRLLTLIAHNPPVLVLYERNGLSPRTSQIFKSVLCNVLKEPLSNESQFWSAEKTLKTLAEKYYMKIEGGKWPDELKSFQDDGDHLGLTPKSNSTLVLKALGGCIWYLTRCLLDQQTLSLARYEIYCPPDAASNKEDVEKLKKKATKAIAPLNANKHLVLDSITLSNLKITGEEGSLITTLDHCCTKFGKRLLYYWVCSPSCDANVIRERQAAITELLLNSELLQELRLLLGTLPDIERQLAQIHSFGCFGLFKDHPDSRAILYEEVQYGKKKIQNFISAIKAFENLTKLPSLMGFCKSNLIKSLTQLEPIGSFPNMKETIKFFDNAFNHEEALKEGIIAPENGVDAEFDAIEEEIKDINHEMDQYVKIQEKNFNCCITLGTNRNRFQLEIPEGNAKKAGRDFHLEGQQKKGSKCIKRYHTDETKELLKRMTQSENQRKVLLKDLSRRIFEKFASHFDVWKICVNNVAILDVLSSLAEYARNQGNTCVPEIIDDNSMPILQMEDGYHPCMVTSEDFIPNGITLGHPDAPLALLTGPNMGGKSTLMRQIGLLVIMAQIGSRIPAKSCRMTLVDRIFTRLGAQDDIMAGHSTFLVELSETSAILKHATVHSLVLLDELGRGTATYDGTAIAAAVVNFLAELECRALFSTHYHSLVDNFHDDKRVSLGHMACMVENEDENDPTQETVTFLYKYSDGPCPKSYGFNAAKLAGMPNVIIKRAHELSKKVESTALKRKLFSKILSNSTVDQIKDLLGKLKSCTIK